MAMSVCYYLQALSRLWQTKQLQQQLKFVFGIFIGSILITLLSLWFCPSSCAHLDKLCWWFRSRTTDARRGNSPSLNGRKSTPTPKSLGTAEAYFVCHIGQNFQISLIYAFIGCPQSVDLGHDFCLFYKSKLNTTPDSTGNSCTVNHPNPRFCFIKTFHFHKMTLIVTDTFVNLFKNFQSPP